MRSQTPQWLEVCGQRLEYVDFAARRADRPPLLFLHEGLGSVQQWRDFPERVAAVTGCRSVVYSRLGFGRSSPRRQPYTPRFMHEEALEVVPRVRDLLGLSNPALIGHSTGASMALIHAGAGRWPVAGVVAMAPIAFIEESNLASICKARDLYRNSEFKSRLARYHDDVDSVFWGWNDTWLDPAFRHWSLEADLPAIACPILAIRGEHDEYVTPAQVDRIVQQALRAGPIEHLELAHCGHAPHRDQPEAVIEAIDRFVDRLAAR